ncbi:hypothetical protein V6N13_127163 [Hibiscus sabdariffa]|uniref:DNA mismatch repair protein MLH3 n=1 Tax=Hibiscus sabdariffa TaxID=183260 RepID=A0ABR2RDB8_9ROSI
MGSIKPLPEAVRATVRSASILFDLTRVVEELIFNSLDADASKVSVFLSAGSGYVKVVDDGSGISRDGLVLLGERYVTSKLSHLSDLDAASSSFGFRGETLASISDVASVEIVTKAYGRPNGYRKVIKGSKCLYLGIDDDREDVGTTVVVRDLFYNQPVRKKHMQSSPKKVLHSVKKCVFRIALVHPMVYFNVIDMESEDELLSVHPSSSPLPLLMSGLGIEDCACLQKLNANDGPLKLTGYISGPCDGFSFKTFQYVYINSRFICKGPIHKFLNNLATSFESLYPEKTNNWTKNGKRSRSQVVPSFIMNISCPPSFYDLTFEPSKAYVEFKDWKPIFTFIEKGIQHLWRKNISCGQAETLKEYDNISYVAEDFSDGASLDLEFATRKRTKKYQPSSSLDKLTIDNLFLMEHEDMPFEKYNGNTTLFKDQQNDMKFVPWTDFSFQSWGDSLSKTSSIVNQRSDWHLWSSDNNFLAENCFLETGFMASGRPNCLVDNNNISSELCNEFLKVESSVTDETVISGFPFDYRELWTGSQFRKNISTTFLRSCSSQRTWPLDRELVESKGGVESPLGSFKTKKQVCSNESFNMLEVGISDQTFDHRSKVLWQDGESCSQIYPKLVRTGGIPRDFDVLRRSAKLFLSCDGDVSVEENGLLAGSVTLSEKSVSGYQSLNLGTSNPFARFSYKNAVEESFRSEKRTNFEHFSDGEDEDNQFGFDLISRGSSQEKCIHDCPNTELKIDYAESSREFGELFQEYNLNHKFSPERFNVVTEDRYQPCSDSGFNECKRQRDCFHYQDCRKNFSPKERSRRSQSAPPFYIQKRSFISHHCSRTSEESTSNETHGLCTSLETGDKKLPQQSSSVHKLYFEPSFGKNRSDMDNKPGMVFGTIVQKCEKIEHHCLADPELVPVQVSTSNGNRDPKVSASKWKDGFQQNTSNSKLYDTDNEDNLLDIASGFLYLAAESLIPKSIGKKCLTDAKVLQQVDKKFIPIVAGGTLAIIDQHAADERIKLEELRHMVLSGEGKSVTYLDTEKELILPEMGYQLLHNYSEQIRQWGWICDFHTQDSRSFQKNLNLIHPKPAVVKLLAVPCILGVNLSDADLLEFLHQLADTDGSSTMPPSVSRILNCKACRGAIMFGDSLLPSECSLIVEELKQTSLCFQCAHGRPTTAPLVKLEALHRQIAMMQERDDEPREIWHGLYRQRVSLERASLRLRAADGITNKRAKLSC